MLALQLFSLKCKYLLLYTRSRVQGLHFILYLIGKMIIVPSFYVNEQIGEKY